MLLFRHHVVKNLIASGRIGQGSIDILNRFHHPGFSACDGEGVSAGDSIADRRQSLIKDSFVLDQWGYAILRSETSVQKE